MKFPLSARIAYRYLLSKKRYTAVNYISIVSVCGVAIATMAIVCVLSVFNGFKDVLGGKLDQLSPDIKVMPAKGKVIESVDSIIPIIEQMDGVNVVMPTIEDNALAICNRRQLPIKLKGVDADEFAEITSIKSLVKEDGQYLLRRSSEVDADSTIMLSENVVMTDDLDEEALFAYADELYGDELNALPADEYYALISVGVAVSLKAYPSDLKSLYLFVPRRIGAINMGNPATSFISDSISVSGVFQADQAEFDENLVVVDFDLASKMLQYDNQANSIEIGLLPGVNVDEFREALSELLSDRYVVKDRLEQQEVQFKMINVEKWVTFLLLAFILLITSFNMISSMSMLIVEKKESINILRNLGASRSMIGNVFRWESCYVSVAGALSGILLGLILCLIQQYFGVIKLNGAEGSLIISAYPIKVLFSDLIIVILPIIMVGIMTSTISGRYAKSMLSD